MKPLVQERIDVLPPAKDGLEPKRLSIGSSTWPMVQAIVPSLMSPRKCAVNYPRSTDDVEWANRIRDLEQGVIALKTARESDLAINEEARVSLMQMLEGLERHASETHDDIKIAISNLRTQMREEAREFREDFKDHTKEEAKDRRLIIAASVTLLGTMLAGGGYIISMILEHTH